MDAQRTNGPIATVFAIANFRRLWLLGGLVNAMRWVEMLAAALFTFQVTASGVPVALVLVARSLPMLLLGAVAGVVCDSVDRKRMLGAGMAICALSAACVVALALAGVARPWHVAIAAFVSGSVWATELPARRRMIGECAGPEHVSRVIALDSTTNSAARIAGPLMGSLAFATLGLAGAYAISATLYAIAALLVVPGITHSQPPRSLALLRIPRELSEGFRFARRQPAVLAVFAVTAAMNLFAFSYTAMIAPLARIGFGVGDAAAGFLAAGEPVGALLGGVLLARRPPPRTPVAWMVGGSAVFMAALVAMPLIPAYPAACAILVLGGLGLAVFGNTQTSLVLNATPPALRSRQMGLISVCIGVSPLGQLVIGVLAAAAGPRLAVMIAALLGLASLAAIALLYARASTLVSDSVPK